jgi:hypothetical protein
MTILMVIDVLGCISVFISIICVKSHDLQIKLVIICFGGFLIVAGLFHGHKCSKNYEIEHENRRNRQPVQQNEYEFQIN